MHAWKLDAAPPRDGNNRITESKRHFAPDGSGTKINGPVTSTCFFFWLVGLCGFFCLFFCAIRSAGWCLWDATGASIFGPLWGCWRCCGSTSSPYTRYPATRKWWRRFFGRDKHGAGIKPRWNCTGISVRRQLPDTFIQVHISPVLAFLYCRTHNNLSILVFEFLKKTFIHSCI